MPNIRRTIGCSFEYVRVDNSQRHIGLAQAYNEGVARARAEIIVFVHDDVFFVDHGWGRVLRSKFSDPSVGLVGLAGTQYLPKDPPGWGLSGRPFVHGRLVHELNGGERRFLTLFSRDTQDTDVVVVDGLFLAVRASLFDRIRFDDQVFSGFHFYDLDICMQVRRTHRIVVTYDILVVHKSAGSFDDAWHRFAKVFVEKYGAELPARLHDAVSTMTHSGRIEHLPLTDDDDPPPLAALLGRRGSPASATH